MSEIGIDIGGTSVKLGFVEAPGRIRARRLLPVDPNEEAPEFVDRLASACRELEAEAGTPARAVGVSTPGFMDPLSGKLIDGGRNVPALRRESVAGALSALLGLAVVVENDGVAAALGELRFGIGRKFRRFVLVTLGTGVGGAVVIDGRIVTGAAGEPPELGAMVLNANGPPSACGLPGTFEHYASAEAFLRAYEAAGGDREGVGVAELFTRFDEIAAREAVDCVARRIAQAFGALVNALNLEACLIGGGVAAAGKPLIERIEAHLPSFTWPYLLQNTIVAAAATGNDAGVLGAAAMAADRAADLSPSGAAKRVPNGQPRPTP